jgi:hypothetical protein
MTKEWAEYSNYGKKNFTDGVPTDYINTNYKSEYYDNEWKFYYLPRHDLLIGNNLNRANYNLCISQDNYDLYLTISKICPRKIQSKWLLHADELEIIEDSDIEFLKQIKDVCINDLLLDYAYVNDTIDYCLKLRDDKETWQTSVYNGKRRTIEGSKYQLTKE